MTGRNPVRAHIDRVIKERPEFDFRITEHIRVRCTASFVFAKENGENPFLIFLREIHGLEIDSDQIGDA